MKRLLVVLLALVTSLLLGADYAREQRWADEITPGIIIGDPVYLTANKRKFLSIYTPAEEAKGAAIVVHGLGVHPDWTLINVLRTRLPDEGYSTLSVQMPVLDAQAKGDQYAPTFDEAAARIAAAVAYLQKQGYKNIAIVSHSLGARMADRYFVRNPRTPVSAWAVIGMGAPFEAPSKIKVPVLDLYGEQDLPQVLANLKPRWSKAVKLRPAGRQEMVPGANHFFEGHDDELVSAVVGFLDEAW